MVEPLPPVTTAPAGSRRGGVLRGQTFAGTPSKKARSPICVDLSSTLLPTCSRTQPSAIGTDASACLWVSHRLSDTHFLSPRSARPYRMKPGCSWNLLQHPLASDVGEVLECAVFDLIRCDTDVLLHM